MGNLTISILVDNDSWILPWANQLTDSLRNQGEHTVINARKPEEIIKGDICFLLGCTKLVNETFLQLNTHNIVVHESELPQGKGFSPMSWQILEGKNSIPICLFEADSNADAGRIYYRDKIELKGDEISDEWRAIQGHKSIELCKKFSSEYAISKERRTPIKSIDQEGESSYYTRRTPSDSELDISKSIKELFPILRIVDNDSYPAFFKIKEHTYKLQITKVNLSHNRNPEKP